VKRLTLVICLALFAASFAVRVLVWQNNKVEMSIVQSVVTENYLKDARALANGDIRTFLGGDDPPTNARVIDHPPGYPLMVGVVYAFAGEGDAWRVIQIALNSLAPVLLFLIGALLFDRRIGVIAGVLAALSPQFAYHSGLMLPDELSVVPVLAALYFLVRATREPRILYALLCGVFLGLSCWLRSNTLLLPVFIAFSALFVLTQGGRLRFAGLSLAVFLVTIAPITIRNVVYFHAPVPLSLGFGTTFIEGLGDLDDGRRGVPKTDEDVMALDERLEIELGDWYGKPYSSLYDPMGFEREGRRIAFGRRVVTQERLWFASGVAKRGLTTFRLERVPAIAPERDERDATNAALYWLNRPLKVVQRAFITAAFLPFVVLGAGLLVVRKRWRELVLLGVVPLYFATVQPLVHTEYRYVLATPHLLMVCAAIGLCFLFGKLRRLGGRDVNDAAAA
jgi:4-amino-4-deoxy-L-arabinose transferase-like glycosyltransferase